MSEPRPPAVPEAPAGAVLGTGVDLVHVPALAHQLTIPGTVSARGQGISPAICSSWIRGRSSGCA